ncbi:MAG TPA: CCA tRNA nucleotidyltransferase, partial [Sphingomicrobium sp.]|nr:CCA tRNA nucleotidyltransferase [Sphingomicrobium sp.]
MKLDPREWLDRPGIKRLLKALDAEGGHARFVGGAVRDFLLGEHPGDLDLATTHPPDEAIRRLEAAGIKAVPTGIDHGTVTAISSGTVVEVTSLRADVSTDGRRATVAFTDDWKQDAGRRDFTINALYADPYSGELHDYFGGLDDLKSRTVRFIGEPLQRIAEDHLRVLRYFRFHARYGHGDPDPHALEACTRRANDLMALSHERIADELLKLLALDDPTPTIRLMLDRGLFAPVVPEIEDAARLARLVEAERAAGLTPDPLRRLASLLPPVPEIAGQVAGRLKLSNKAKKRLISAADASLGLNP